jgi:predicted nucleic acid-binding protein
VIVLDTNVISEMMRPSPDPAVESWMAGRPAATLFTTTITQGELLYGVALLPAGRRRSALQTALEALFAEDFFGRLLPYDSDAARAFAEIAAARRKLGSPITQFDAQIAAIARSRNAELATRNVRVFHHCGIVVLDPWSG